MGAKLSRRKKGCMGDPNDEKGEQISETSTIEQKDNETDADCDETSTGTLNKNQQGSDPMPCEEQPKNEPQVDETVHQEYKSTVQATQDKTKENPITQKCEDIETVQIKRERNEMHKVAEVIAVQTCKKTASTTAEIKTEGQCAPSEQLPAKQTEEKHKISPAKDPLTCSPSEKNKTAVTSDITLENAPKKPPINENSNDRNKSEEYECSLTEKASNIQSTENKRSDCNPTNSRQLSSANDPHLVSHIDTVAQIHSLNDSKNIVNHANESSINNSDNLEIESQLQDDSDNCEVLNLAQDIKTEEKVSPLSECVHQDYKCILEEDSSTAAVKESSRPPENPETSTDQTSCMPLTESDTKQESSSALEHSLTPTKIENEIEDEVTNDAVVATPSEKECSMVLTEVALKEQQKDTISLSMDDATAGKENIVTEFETELEAPPNVEDMLSPLELVDCAAPEEGYSSDLEASVASSQEASHDEHPNRSGISVLENAVEPEACKDSTETTAQVELAECTSQKVEASLSELAWSSDPTKATTRAETEEVVIQTEMLPTTKQKEGMTPEEVAYSTELKQSDGQGETASPDELEVCLSPEDVEQSAKLEGRMFQIASHDELETCAAQGKVVLSSDPEEFVLQKSIFAATNTKTSVPPAQIDCSAEQQIYATPTEQDLCVDTVTSDLSKLEEPITSEENYSSKPDVHEESTEISTLSEFDANTAPQKHLKREISAEEHTLPMSSCQEEPNSETCPQSAQETNRHSESISLKESENHNESNGNLSPAHAICEKLTPKSDGISSEVISNGDSEINGEHDNRIASNVSPIDY